MRLSGTNAEENAGGLESAIDLPLQRKKNASARKECEEGKKDTVLKRNHRISTNLSNVLTPVAHDFTWWRPRATVHHSVECDLSNANVYCVVVLSPRSVLRHAKAGKLQSYPEELAIELRGLGLG